MPINPVDRAAGDDDQYTLAERCIFAYGLAVDDDVTGDPLAIEARYHEAVSLYDADLAAGWMKDDRLALQFLALEKLWPAFHRALGLPEYDDRTGEGYPAEATIGALRRFFDWRDSIEAKYRLASEMVATYGPVPGKPWSYERYAGMAFNRGRAQCLPAVAHWRAIVAGRGKGKAYYGLADAMAPNPEHARQLDEAIESQRATAEAWAAHQATIQPGR